MQSFVRKFAVKFIEVAGAGLASALCAYVLGQIERAPAPTPMPAVVYISPANVDTALREDHAPPAAIARIEAETPPEAAASAPAAVGPKTVKPAAIAQALSMPLAERQERHNALFRVLSDNEIQQWAERYLAALDRKPKAISQLEQMHSVGS